MKNLILNDFFKNLYNEESHKELADEIDYEINIMEASEYNYDLSNIKKVSSLLRENNPIEATKLFCSLPTNEHDYVGDSITEILKISYVEHYL
jgi:hypothetical protein